MKLNWNFIGGWGVQNKQPPVGGMDIFWNCTLQLLISWRGVVGIYLLIILALCGMIVMWHKILDMSSIDKESTLK